MRSIKIAMHQLNYTTGDFGGNFDRTKNSILSAGDADIHVLAECAVTNYTSGDYFLEADYQEAAAQWLDRYRLLSQEGRTTIVVGSPIRGKVHGRKMCNGLTVFRDGVEVHSCVKTHLPNYDIFDDVRWFESRAEQIGADAEIDVLEFATADGKVTIGFCICEDIWFDDVTHELREKGAEIIISINSSPYAIAKDAFRRNMFLQRVSETGVPLVYVNQVGGNDELVWDGCSAIVDPDGVIYEMEPGKEGVEIVSMVQRGDYGFRNEVAKGPVKLSDPQERYLIVGIGLRDYIEKNGFDDVVFGLSGGADSLLVAALACDVFGPKRVNAALMPSPYSSSGSIRRARGFAGGVGDGFNANIIPITEEFEAAKAKFRNVFGRDMSGLADENLQAQIRGNILSAISNDHGRRAILGTSNKSELLMGYGTLYGDMRAAFNPLKDLYKAIDVFPILEMRLRHTTSPDPLFERIWSQAFGKSLENYDSDAFTSMDQTIRELPSAELLPGQLDTDSLPPYPRLDAVLWEMEDAKERLTDAEIAERLSEPLEFIQAIRRQVRRAEFKRFQSPPGPKVHRKSPTTKDRRFPITFHRP
ncbi:NAD(+) synthase [Agrobacterium tumefaciens]|uniref:NAD(+) synthase n=1 Tax=Agrobacterium tumefaciens TaxID=358 RepID=UPI001572CD91|nr:NAD(+) synthase [Agrobacterium tumefaciens]NSZ66981.1 NAD(+) synthase [Agrobacterium tumefaciens]NTA73348.1 NAD(+) synthase [Agrobacterium tumefaciens]WIE41144.1 NAD(+) synthase [Agrobacterium tumefaciens]